MPTRDLRHRIRQPFVKKHACRLWCRAHTVLSLSSQSQDQVPLKSSSLLQAKVSTKLWFYFFSYIHFLWLIHYSYFILCSTNLRAFAMCKSVTFVIMNIFENLRNSKDTFIRKIYRTQLFVNFEYFYLCNAKPLRDFIEELPCAR